MKSGNGSCIHQNKHPVQDDEYNYHGSLQECLIEGVLAIAMSGKLEKTNDFNSCLISTDHSSDYITVFCTSATGALALAIIVGLLVLYRHHANKQHLQVKEESKLNPYGSTKPKISAEIDPFLAGPIKTPPPDYMMEGCNRQRGGTMPLKKSRNGTIVRTFSAKDVHTKEPNDER